MGESPAKPPRFARFNPGIYWLLEELEHPIVQLAKASKEDAAKILGKVSMKHYGQLLLIYEDPKAAFHLLQKGRADFDSAAFDKFSAIDPAEFEELIAELLNAVSEMFGPQSKPRGE